MKRDSTPKPQERPAVEWVFGILSGCGVVLLLAYLGWQALFSSSHPPELTVSLVDIGPRVATIEVANGGDRAALAVTVLAGAGDGPPRVVEFDHVAPHSTRRGAFGVPPGLQAGDLRLEIGGFAEP
ncbi:hypothetical protein [uncultured Paracoccus sp.]|uniref:hypothetical protein n=1 Tax=uncultured Paracoccus sp. TaxID=189685 RepID=UPI0025FEBA6C|nr:hypothetical protein [uncultured Paracoccus sp.]